MSIGDLGTRLRSRKKKAKKGQQKLVALLKTILMERCAEPTLKRDKTEVQSLVIPETLYG